MLRYILLFLKLIAAIHVTGQTSEPYLFSHMGARQGLASDETNAIQQDQKGFMWIGTSNGLQRFDGRRFINFLHRNGDSTSIPNDEISSLCMDQKNRLWLVCQGNRAGYFDVSKHVFHEVLLRSAGKVTDKPTGSLVMDKKGKLFLLLQQDCILSFNEARNEFSQDNNGFKLPAGWHPASFTSDPHQNYWIACDSGLIKFTNDRQMHVSRRNNDGGELLIRAIQDLEDLSGIYPAQDRTWIITHKPGSLASSLLSYDLHANKLTDHTVQVRRMLKNGAYEINNITVQKDGTTWISGNNILARYNENAREFELVESNLPGEFSIRYETVTDLYEDREHSLWTCTNRGLFRFNPEAQVFNSFLNKRTGSDTRFDENVLGITQTGNGNILVNTEGAGIFTYDGQFKPTSSGNINLPGKPAETVTHTVYERSTGTICKGTANGYLYIYDPRTGRNEKFGVEPMEGSSITQMAEDRNGNLWLGSDKGHLVKWDLLLNRFLLIQKYNGAVNKLYTDFKKDLWVCTSGTGVYRLNTSDGSITAHYTAEGKEGRALLNAGALDILQYDDSLYLIASDGLNVLNTRTNRFNYFSKGNGFLTNSVTNIVKDKLGYVWVTTKPWLCSINLQKDVVTYYDERDGLHYSSFTPGSACLLKDGRIAIGTPHDVLLFDPLKANKNASLIPPDITISGFAVMNKWLPMDSINRLAEIVLKPDQNSISIELSTLTYQTIYGFFYMLEGLDKDWKVSPQQNQVTFNYLPPGSYTFKTICRNGDGTPSKNITELKIIVKRVFWKTWWFYSLFVAALIFIIYFTDRERMKRKASLQYIRSNIADNLHQEVNIALNNINILSEMARIKADSEPGKSKEYIEQIHHKSHEMIIAMDDMLWSLNPENDRMEKTVERMEEYIDSLKNRYGIHIEMSVDKKVTKQVLNMKLRHEAFLLFKEGIRSLVQAGSRNCKIHIGMGKNNLRYTMQFENAHCDMQQLNNLLHRQDLEKNMRSINATFNVQVNKTHSLFELQVPVP